MASRNVLFGVLGLLSAYIMYGKVLRQEAFWAFRTQDTPDCVAHRYTFLSHRLNALLCRVNTLFTSVRSVPAASPVVQMFGALFVSVVAIFNYNDVTASRRPGLGGMLGILYGQFGSAAVGVPTYLALSRAAHSRGPESAKGPEYGWTALLSMVLGYMLPTQWVVSSGWAYNPLSFWQIFPLVCIALNFLLPYLIRKLIGRSSSSAFSIIAIAIIGFATSLRAHYAFLTSSITFAEAFLPKYGSQRTFGQASHIIFLVDFLLVFTSMANYVLTLSKQRSSAFLSIAALTALAGPGAAIASVWASQEVQALRQQSVKVSRKA